MTQLIFALITTEMVTNFFICVISFKLFTVIHTVIKFRPLATRIVIVFIRRNAKEFKLRTRFWTELN
jgi:hypothetical protein